LGFRYAGTHVDTIDAWKAPQPVRGRCVTWRSMMKALLIFTHCAERILHMHNYAEKLPLMVDCAIGHNLWQCHMCIE